RRAGVAQPLERAHRRNATTAVAHGRPGHGNGAGDDLTVECWGDLARSRRSRRWGARIAREAGSPCTQARAASLRTRLLRHGEAELVGHDVAGRLTHTAGDGLLRALRPPARGLL